jgi:hypothetical protein
VGRRSSVRRARRERAGDGDVDFESIVAFDAAFKKG